MLTDHPFLAAMQAFDLHISMGIEWHEADAGRSRISFAVSPRMMTPSSSLHAGFLYTACDAAAAIALMSELPHEQSAVTHDIHVSVMRSAGPDDRVYVLAEIVKRGRQLAFLDARCLVGDRLLATARVTKSILYGGSSPVA